MNQNNDRTTRYWLTGSAENFAKAERDFKLGDNVYALFWLHLAAEKLIKEGGHNETYEGARAVQP